MKYLCLIHWNEKTLAEMPAVEPTHFQDLYAVDAEARERAEGLIQGAVA